MLIRLSSVITLLAGLSLVNGASHAAQTTAPATSKFQVVYKPIPGANLTKTRVDSIGRSGGVDKLPLLSVVAPDHTGTTIAEQPQLYWYISDATKLTVETYVIEEGSEKKVYEFASEGVDAGFHCLDLAKEGVHLDINKRYQFTINVVVDPRKRAKDLGTSGYISRIKAPDNLPPAKDAFVALLNSGIWYDGVADLMKQLDSHKDDADLTAARDALLKQVGLGEITTKPGAGAKMQP